MIQHPLLIMSKAMFPVMQALRDGPKRFSFLEKHVNVSPKTLSDTLKRLEFVGALERNAYAEIPPRVEYDLTPKGQQIAVQLETLADLLVDALLDIPAMPEPPQLEFTPNIPATVD